MPFTEPSMTRPEKRIVSCKKFRATGRTKGPLPNKVELSSYVWRMGLKIHGRQQRIKKKKKQGDSNHNKDPFNRRERRLTAW